MLYQVPFPERKMPNSLSCGRLWKVVLVILRQSRIAAWQSPGTLNRRSLIMNAPEQLPDSGS